MKSEKLLGKSMRSNMTGMVTLLVEIVVAVVLLPIVITQINEIPNLTSVQNTILSLVPIFICLGIIILTATRMGLFKK